MIRICCSMKKDEDTIYISDDTVFLKRKKEEGKAVIRLLSKEEGGADFSSFRYAVMENEAFVLFCRKKQSMQVPEAAMDEEIIPCTAEELDAVWGSDYLEKVWRHTFHLPVKITESSRLSIRELEAGDFEAVCSIFRTENARRFLDGFGEDRVDAEEAFRNYIGQAYDISEFGIFAVLEKQSKKQNLVGLVSLLPRGETDSPRKTDLKFIRPLSHTENERKQCGPEGEMLLLELGFALQENAGRKGYALEMCEALLAYFKDRLEEDAGIISYASKDNSNSIALLKKLGFIPADT